MEVSDWPNDTTVRDDLDDLDTTFDVEDESW